MFNSRTGILRTNLAKLWLQNELTNFANDFKETNIQLVLKGKVSQSMGPGPNLIKVL
jgi:hypothetical protein